VDIVGADAGMHLVLWLPSRVDARDVQRRAATRGLDVIPVSAFSIERPVGPGLVLGYAHLDPVRIRRACRQLADMVAVASRLRA
jgi:GntR family transcriptional regulator/MocR family aminotransferase